MELGHWATQVPEKRERVAYNVKRAKQDLNSDMKRDSSVPITTYILVLTRIVIVLRNTTPWYVIEMNYISAIAKHAQVLQL